MRVLLWHVHGAYATAFVHGPFDVTVPVQPGRGPDGLGLPTTYSWPPGAVEAPLAAVGRAVPAPDVVLLQRPHEIGLLREATGLRAGLDVPAVYLEHNAPRPSAVDSRHPMADQTAIPVVHVTHFNRLMWDTGRARSLVVEHGVPDHGPLWRGRRPHAAVVVNEPLRRGRITGTDLLPMVALAAPVDVYGMGTGALTSGDHGYQVVGHGDLPQRQLLDELADRRVYVHLCRWTSLGLALLEALMLGMPAVGLATTEAPEGLAGSGVVLSNQPAKLTAAIRRYIHDREAAAHAGRRARSWVRQRYGLPRFHADWERVMKEVAG
jgi:hypothetical protein